MADELIKDADIVEILCKHCGRSVSLPWGEVYEACSKIGPFAVLYGFRCVCGAAPSVTMVNDGTKLI